MTNSAPPDQGVTTPPAGEQSTETAHIRFERIGRNHVVSDMPIEGDPTDLDNVAEQAWKHARQYLGSRWFDVTADEAGTVLIECGRFGRGVICPPEGSH